MILHVLLIMPQLHRVVCLPAPEPQLANLHAWL